MDKVPTNKADEIPAARIVCVFNFPFYTLQDTNLPENFYVGSLFGGFFKKKMLG
jgi:hypothetical protein